MAFRDNAYATIWETRTTNGPSLLVRLSTSYKDKKTDQYVSDFSDYVFFSGDAAKKAAKLKEKDRVKLLQTSVSSRWDKDKKVNHYVFNVWDFEMADGKGGTGTKPAAAAPKAAPAVEEDNDELPF